MKKKLFGGALAVLVLALIISTLVVSLPAYREKAQDPRNDTVTMLAHLRWGLDPTTLVIDLLSIRPTASMLDVDRSLLDMAAALSDYRFNQVHLAWRGQTRFVMDGSYFQTLGKERDFQNPVYVLRTLPENMYTPSGRQAFGTWTGGVLGVVSRQMEDHNQMHEDWYMLDAIRSF